jgi:hypothetical protein
MTKLEELKDGVRAFGSLAERLDECSRRIGFMCMQCRGPRMSIPVQWDDDDFFISTTLQDATSALQDAGYPTKGDHDGS